MEPKPVHEVISSVISAAAHAAGWSMAKLARHLSMDENRLLRWRKGTVAKYDMGHIVELFRLAGLSMDEEFGLNVQLDTAARLDQQLDEMRGDIDQLQGLLEQLAPVANLLAAFARAFGESGEPAAGTAGQRKAAKPQRGRRAKAPQ